MMPNPLEILSDPVSLYLQALYALLIIWEAVFPARQLPLIKNWKWKGILSFYFFFFLSTYLPLAYASWLPSSALFDLSTLNPYLAAIIAILVYELGVYIWHRLMHSSELLWRIFHQIHHSAERLDTYGAFFFSPMDMIGFTVLGTLSISVLVGIAPEAVTIFLLVSNFFSVFQHANIKTPVWLGYLIQRPESHSIHHSKGVHANNYSDLPVFDMLFGTFKNPAKFADENGLYLGASGKLKDMLLFRNISKRNMLGAILIMCALSVAAQRDSLQVCHVGKAKWLIEPLKITSLQVNTHPEYNGWGLEIGRRLSNRLWITTMIEKTQGGDFLKNFKPEHDFLINLKYFVWINTFRYYLKPDARYTTFFDAGLIYQSASHKFLRAQKVAQEKARAVGPALFIGGEGRIYKQIYFKWRSGFFFNVYRGGDMKSRMDDGQNQPPFFMYPHLSDAVIGKGTYAGDLALGLKF